MIVVVGDPVLFPPDGGASVRAIGAAVAIARACGLAGATVQLVGKVGDDPAGDEILLALTSDGIGHVALLRDMGAQTRIEQPSVAGIAADPAAGPAEDDEWAVAPDAPGDDDGSDGLGDPPAPPVPRAPATVSTLAPEDLDLALRYLSSFAVLIVAQPLSPTTLAVAVESAAYAGAHLILIDVTDEMADAVAAVPVDDITALESPVNDPDEDFAALIGRYAAALDGGTAPAAAFRAALGAAGWESTIA